MVNRKLVMALAAAVVMAALYGCSGSNSSIKEARDSALADLATEQAARMAADAARAEAEAAQAAAEAAQAAAEAARATAEEDKATADAARATAEAAQAAAEAAQTAATAAQAAAEAAQAAAEGDRDAAVTARDTAILAQGVAEGARAVAETAQTEAEAAEAAAKMAAADSESARATEAAARMAAEEAQAAAEAARATAETAQAAAEAARMTAEAAQAAAMEAQAAAEADAAEKTAAAVAAMAAQATAETAQATAETAQAAAETAQATAEDDRDAAVTARMAAEDAQAAAEETAKLATGDAATAVAAKVAAEEAQKKAEDAEDAAVTARDSAVVAQKAAEDAKDVALLAQTDAETKRDQALKDLGVSDAGLMKANADLMKANADLMKAYADLMKAYADIANLEDKLRDKTLTAAAKEASAKAEKLLGKIMITADATGALTRGQTKANEAGGKTVLPSRTDAGVSILVDRRKNAKKEDVSDYKASADMTAATPAINGWDHSVVADVDKSVTKSVTIYTNIGDKIDKQLLLVEGEETNAFFKLDSKDDDNGAADFKKNARTSNWPTAPSDSSQSTKVALGSLKTLPGPTERLEFTGSWLTVPGTFICSICTSVNEAITLEASLNTKGEEIVTVTISKNDWVFEPDNPKATVEVPDDDYLYFGWWQEVKKQTDGTFDIGFRTLAGGTPTFSSAIKLVTDAATYEGVAAGKYAMETGTRLSPTYEAGIFTATAKLEAEFGTSGVDPTIEGEITNFKNAAGDDKGWTVDLGELTVKSGTTAATDDKADTPDAAVWKIDTTTQTSDAGEWSVGFFGNSRSDGQPGSVSGRFNASFKDANAHIAGAYGAVNTSVDN